MDTTPPATPPLPLLPDDHLVVVQPHLDDAVLSCFGLMAAAVRVSVITVCAGVPDPGTAPTLYDRLTGSDDPHQRLLDRRQEDIAALARLGASPIHLDVLDAPYRRRTPSSSSLVRRIVRALPTDATLLAFPAGIGGHPDHRLVNATAVTCRDETGLPMVVFADYPYAATAGWPSTVTGRPPLAHLRPEVGWERDCTRMARWGVTEQHVIRLSAEQQAAKIATFACYRTQVDAIEQGPSLEVSHPDRIGFEVLWSRPTSATP